MTLVIFAIRLLAHKRALLGNFGRVEVPAHVVQRCVVQHQERLRDVAFAVTTAAVTHAAGVPHKATPLWPLRPKVPIEAHCAATARWRPSSSNHSRRVVTFLLNT